jgi:hypothetical protein
MLLSAADSSSAIASAADFVLRWEDAVCVVENRSMISCDY